MSLCPVNFNLLTLIFLAKKGERQRGGQADIQSLANRQTESDIQTDGEGVCEFHKKREKGTDREEMRKEKNR